MYIATSAKHWHFKFQSKMLCIWLQLIHNSIAFPANWLLCRTIWIRRTFNRRLAFSISNLIWASVRHEQTHSHFDYRFSDSDSFVLFLLVIQIFRNKWLTFRIICDNRAICFYPMCVQKQSKFELTHNSWLTFQTFCFFFHRQVYSTSAKNTKSFSMKIKWLKLISKWATERPKERISRGLPLQLISSDIRGVCIYFNVHSSQFRIEIVFRDPILKASTWLCLRRSMRVKLCGK